jgi:ribosomal protein L21E
MNEEEMSVEDKEFLEQKRRELDQKARERGEPTMQELIEEFYELFW